MLSKIGFFALPVAVFLIYVTLGVVIALTLSRDSPKEYDSSGITILPIANVTVRDVPDEPATENHDSVVVTEPPSAEIIASAITGSTIPRYRYHVQPILVHPSNLGDSGYAPVIERALWDGAIWLEGQLFRGETIRVAPLIIVQLDRTWQYYCGFGDDLTDYAWGQNNCQPDAKERVARDLTIKIGRPPGSDPEIIDVLFMVGANFTFVALDSGGRPALDLRYGVASVPSIVEQPYNPAGHPGWVFISDAGLLLLAWPQYDCAWSLECRKISGVWRYDAGVAILTHEILHTMRIPHTPEPSSGYPLPIGDLMYTFFPSMSLGRFFLSWEEKMTATDSPFTWSQDAESRYDVQIAAVCENGAPGIRYKWTNNTPAEIHWADAAPRWFTSYREGIFYNVSVPGWVNTAFLGPLEPGWYFARMFTITVAGGANHSYVAGKDGAVLVQRCN